MLSKHVGKERRRELIELARSQDLPLSSLFSRRNFKTVATICLGITECLLAVLYFLLITSLSGDEGRAAVDVSCATPGTWPIPAQEVDLVGIRQIHPRRGIYDDQLLAS